MEETFELIKKAQTGDEKAKEILLEKNSPLIKSVIKHYKNKGAEYDDLYQLGCVGFLKAIKNFSIDFGVRFSTYAVPMIAGEVKRFLRDDGYIKISRSTKSIAAKINYFIEEYRHANTDSPSIDLIAQKFNMDAQEVIFAMDSIKQPISIYESADEKNSQMIIDKLASKEGVEDNIDYILLKELISKLDKRDKMIIILRYYRDKTQSEVAKVLNVSQVQVSRLETKILSKLKEELSI